MRSRLFFARSVAALLALAPGAALADPPAKGAAAASVPAAPKPAPIAPAAKSPAAAKPVAAATTKPKAVAGKKKKKQDAPITGPIATYPGFRMLDGGGSRVSVALSKKVTVTEHKAEGKLTYRIQGMQVPTRNNRRPLLTTFFTTPVSRIELVERDGDVDLVIDLRAATTPQHRLVESDRGVELQVDFPKPATEAQDDAAEAAPASDTAAPAATTSRPAKSIESNAGTAY